MEHWHLLTGLYEDIITSKFAAIIRFEELHVHVHFTISFTMTYVIKNLSILVHQEQVLKLPPVFFCPMWCRLDYITSRCSGKRAHALHSKRAAEFEPTCTCDVGFFNVLQHLQDMLELDMSAIAFMMKCFPEIKEVEDMRKSIGRYGLTGKQQVSAVRNLFFGTPPLKGYNKKNCCPSKINTHEYVIFVFYYCCPLFFVQHIVEGTE